MTSDLDPVWRLSERIGAALVEPTLFFGDPTKRIFWGYLVMSLVIASLALALKDRQNWPKLLLNRLLSPLIWLHPSSLLDMKLMIAKSIVKAVLWVPWLISSYGLAILVVRLANRSMGSIETLSLNNTWIAVRFYSLVWRK